MPKKLEVFARLKAASRTQVKPPSLYRWFLTHHYEFAAVLAQVGRPSWDTIVTELQSEGLTLKSGERLTTGYARQAWWKADRTVKLKQAARVAPQPVPALRGREVAHGVIPAAAAPSVIDDAPMVDEPPASGFRFTGPATLRGHTPVPPAAEPPEPAPRPPVQDVEEVIARLLNKPYTKLKPD